jgi:hypothetical protein
MNSSLAPSIGLIFVMFADQFVHILFFTGKYQHVIQPLLLYILYGTLAIMPYKLRLLCYVAEEGYPAPALEVPGCAYTASASGWLEEAKVLA